MSLNDLLELTPAEKASLFDVLINALRRVDKPPPKNNQLQPKKPPKNRDGKHEHVSVLAPQDEPCFTRLKTWRNQVARDLDMAPYMVFDNKTLMAVAHYKPQSEDDFLKIKGIGPDKLGKYYHALLDNVNQPEIKRLLKPQIPFRAKSQPRTDEEPPTTLPPGRLLPRQKIKD